MEAFFFVLFKVVCTIQLAQQVVLHVLACGGIRHPSLKIFFVGRVEVESQ